MAAPSTPFPLQHSGAVYGQDEIYRWLDDLFTEGVVSSTDGTVTQNGAGSMSVNVAAGEAYVTFDTPYGGKRKVVWTATTSGTPGSPTAADNWVSTFTAAHGSNPRVDRVVLTVQDASLDATGQRRAVFQVVAGTATSGATLVNLTGAAAVPANSILLANVLVRAAATTILTADIDTTVATVRPQSALGGRILAGGGMTKISEVSLSASATTIDFSSISGLYSVLKLFAYVRGDNASTLGENVLLRMNNDSAANYYTETLLASAAATVAAESLAATSAIAGTMPKGSDAANRFSDFEITITNYANTVNKKAWHSVGVLPFNTGSTNVRTFHHGGVWDGVAAINRLTLLPGTSTNFVSGSKVLLYGLA